MKCELGTDPHWDVAYFTSKDNKLVLAVRTPSHLRRLLNGRTKAFFEGCLVDRHVRFDRMLTDEESEVIAW
jgi:hypothetical protein